MGSTCLSYRDRGVVWRRLGQKQLLQSLSLSFPFERMSAMCTKVCSVTVYPVAPSRLHSLWLLIVFLLLNDANALAQASEGAVQEVRTIYPSEWDVPYPAGLAYAMEPAHLFLLDKGSAASLPHARATAVIITPYEDLVATVPLAFAVDDAINMAYDDAAGRLLLLNNQQAELVQVALGEDGTQLDIARFDIAHLGLEDAEGMAVAPASRQLFILDGGASQIIVADIDHKFDLVAKIDLAHLRASTLRGIAVHPITHHLFVMSPPQEQLCELTPSGQLIGTYDLAALELTEPQGLAFGLSADLTDAPDTVHLFVADSSLPSRGATNIGQGAATNPLNLHLLAQLSKALLSSRVHSAPPENVLGRILEVALEPGKRDMGGALSPRLGEATCALRSPAALCKT